MYVLQVHVLVGRVAHATLRTLRGKCEPGSVFKICVAAFRKALGGSVPEVHSLGTNGTVPELLEASGLGACSRVDSSTGICALEERSEGAEDAGAWAERHVCCVLSSCSVSIEGIQESRVSGEGEAIGSGAIGKGEVVNVAMSGLRVLRWDKSGINNRRLVAPVGQAVSGLARFGRQLDEH